MLFPLTAERRQRSDSKGAAQAAGGPFQMTPMKPMKLYFDPQSRSAAT
jgi:hypothetical protein